MQVGGEVAGGGEDTLVVLAFTLAVELLPPLAHEVELGLVVDENLDLLAGLLVECVAHGSILGGDILGKGSVDAAGLLHILGTAHETCDVESGTGDGQQTHRCEHREAATHIVGDDEAGVALLVGAGAGGTALGIGHGHDDLTCHLLATLLLALALEQTEGEGGLGGGTRLGDIDDTELLVFQIIGEFGQVVFADVVACKEDGGVLCVAQQPGKRVAQCFDDGTCAQIAAADTSHDDGLAVLTQHVGAGLQLGDELGGDGGGKVEPSQEIVAGTGAVLKGLLSGLYLRLEGLYCASFQKLGSLRCVEGNHFHNQCMFLGS